jgi:hypothetical protein
VQVNAPTQTLTTGVTSGLGSVSPSYPNGYQEQAGTSVSVTATAEPGWSFASPLWSVSGAYCSGGSSSNPCTFTMPNGPVSVYASFTRNPPSEYTITVSTSPPGLDIPQGGGTYAQGTLITISVSNVDGYTFQKWQRDSLDYPAQQSFQYTVDASHTFTAIFTQNFGFSISTPSSQSTSQGSSVTFSFTVTTTSGTPRSVTLSLLNPPPGIGTPSWSQNPVTPSTSGTSVQLTITTSCSTPAQAYDNPQISGQGGGTSAQSSTFSLTVSPSPSCQGTLSVAPVSPPSPSNGATVLSSPATFQVLVSSGGVVRDAAVLVYVDGSQVCSGNSDTNGYYSCSYALNQIGHTYTWYATASKSGYNLGSSEQSSFGYQPNQPTVKLSPTSGPPGTAVAVHGSGFALGDTTCTITSSPSGLISSPQCTVSGGTVYGSFTVAPGASDAYTVVVTGNSGDAGSATFTAASGPTLTVSPGFGPTGTMLLVTGSGWQLSDTSVAFHLTSSPNNGPLWNSPDPVCSISNGNILSGCSLQVRSDAWGGTYRIAAIGSSGDSTTAEFAVQSTLILTPNGGPPDPPSP